MKRKSLAFGLIASVSWGLSTVLTKRLLAELDPLPLLTIQLIWSSVFLWTGLTAWRRPLLPLRTAVKLSLPGIMQPGLAFLLGTVGLSYTTASSDALIWATETIIIVAFSWLMLGERISSALVCLALLGALGTAMATFTPADTKIGATQLFGNLLIFGGVIFASFYTIMAKRQLGNVEPIQLFTLHQLAALALVAPITIIFSLLGVCPHWFPPSISVFLLSALSGVMLFGLPFCLFMTAIRDLGAARSALLLNLPPLVILVGSYVFLGERLTAVQWLGAAGSLIAASSVSVLKEK